NYPVMELVTPGLGLIFWKSLSFVIVLLILRKFAWQPILKGLEERESTIAESLKRAKFIEKELTELEEVKDQKFREAEKLRLEIVARARAEGDQIIKLARTKATEDAELMLRSAQNNLESLKHSVLGQLKSQIANLSLDMAEKVLHDELKDKESSKELVTQLLNKATMN
ncbi:MAG TPA: F0F1 ATP synthase subunit B, partial [Bacteroidales bacterium]|nr:F0F1 ATP synthase subunit B [Bacteroidales bacterium]